MCSGFVASCWGHISRLEIGARWKGRGAFKVLQLMSESKAARSMSDKP